ncbi:hypothetical protein FRC18_012108 [Serendipita sp. 400]|nr:hypothetical protein FRC18_012108 [Serendipita sp. 400]
MASPSSSFTTTTRLSSDQSISSTTGQAITTSGSSLDSLTLESSSFTSSSTLTTASSEPVTASSAVPSPSNASKLNKSALIGIVAGSASLFLLVCIAATLFVWRRRRRRRANSEETPPRTELVSEKRPSHSRGPSHDIVPRPSGGERPIYEPIVDEPQTATIVPSPTTLHYNKAESMESATPNLRMSVAAESENHERESRDEKVRESALLDPFSSGYLPPPSPTPSEYVIVEHTGPVETPVPTQTLRDKRESRTSLLDTVVPEEGGREYSTLGSVVSGRNSTLGHRRTRSGEPSTSSTPPPTKRMSRRLQKPRPSIESTSSFLRPTSPSMNQRSTTPIKFPRDAFDASLEEEPVSALRPSLDNSRISSDIHEEDDQAQPLQPSATSPRPSMSGRPSFDNATLSSSIAGTVTEKGTIPRKRSHVRSPSSPTRMLVNSPSSLGLGKRPAGASSSALSLHQHIQDSQKNGPYIHMPSPTSMVDASVYDFDIYRQPEDIPPPPPLPTSAASATTSHPPPASIARLSAALSIGGGGDPYGSAGSKKRFSASMSDLPNIAGPSSSQVTLPASGGGSGGSKHLFPYSSGNRMSASMSTSNLSPPPHNPNRESTISSSHHHHRISTKSGLEPTTNLYVPKESLDLPP